MSGSQPQTNIPSIGAMAAGLVVAAADVSPVSKAFSAVEHGAESFIQHNADLTPVIEGAKQAVENLASKHGLTLVWSVLQDLFPFLSELHHTETTVAAAPPASPASPTSGTEQPGT